MMGQTNLTAVIRLVSVQEWKGGEEGSKGRCGLTGGYVSRMRDGEGM